MHDVANTMIEIGLSLFIAAIVAFFLAVMFQEGEKIAQINAREVMASEEIRAIRLEQKYTTFTRDEKILGALIYEARKDGLTVFFLKSPAISWPENEKTTNIDIYNKNDSYVSLMELIANKKNYSVEMLSVIAKNTIRLNGQRPYGTVINNQGILIIFQKR